MIKKLIVFIAMATNSTCLFSATAVPLDRQSNSYLTDILKESSFLSAKELVRSVDFNKTLHIRMQQQYEGYPVWGGDFIIHIPHQTSDNKKMTSNGVIYQNLDKDLLPANEVLTVSRQNKAENFIISQYQHSESIHHKKTSALVYIDKNNKAHWVYQITFFDQSKPAAPTYLIDTQTFQIYKHWNDLKSADDNVKIGGFGGNGKIGKLIYDGLSNHLDALDGRRDAKTKICYMKNDYAEIQNFILSGDVEKFNCEQPDPEHNYIYWDGERDAIRGSYSQNHDALYATKVIHDLYQSWYNQPFVWIRNNQPIKIVISTHLPDNSGSFWEPDKVRLSENIYLDNYYPMSSLGVIAHEIHHGVTDMYSQLIYADQSGAINESYSDMAAQAAEFYAYGHSSWQFAYADVVTKNKALRYMDDPSKDCELGLIPGVSCSVTHMNQLQENREDYDVHYTSGIFNRAFYLLATSPNWDTHKAFNVMHHANTHYWTSNITFSKAACLALISAKDYQYDVTAVSKAFAEVGINTSTC